jgi:UDP-glucose:(heptosyl)LPS alpha-1,3-glucosyltransferase
VRGRLYRLTPRARAMLAMERAVFEPAAHTEILLLVEREKESFQRHYGTPDRRLHVIPPILSPDCYYPEDAAERRRAMRAALKLNERTHALLFVAASFRTKGLDRALAAVGSLPGPLRDRTRLLVVGGDDARPYRRLVASRWATFLGPRDDLPDMMLAADLLIHPAREENAGKVLLEAMTTGLPVLCSGICGYAEHVARADAGTVLPEPFRQDALDRALAEMLAQLPQADWGRNGIAYAERTPGFGQGIATVVETVERLAAERRRS